MTVTLLQALMNNYFIRECFGGLKFKHACMPKNHILHIMYGLIKFANMLVRYTRPEGTLQLWPPFGHVVEKVF